MNAVSIAGLAGWRTGRSGRHGEGSFRERKNTANLFVRFIASFRAGVESGFFLSGRENVEFGCNYGSQKSAFSFEYIPKHLFRIDRLCA